MDGASYSWSLTGAPPRRATEQIQAADNTHPAGTLGDGTPIHYTAVVLGNAPVIIGANHFAISWITATGSVFQTSGALIDGYIVVPTLPPL